VRNWWRQDGHGLVLDDLVEVLDDLPVGIGQDHRSASRKPTQRPAQRRHTIGASVSSPGKALERIPWPLTLADDLGKRRSAQRLALDT
jgi:hypothetical protein